MSNFGLLARCVQTLELSFEAIHELREVLVRQLGGKGLMGCLKLVEALHGCL